MVTCRQMLRQCGFQTKDGKVFNRAITNNYWIEAVIDYKFGNKVVVCTKIFNDSPVDTRNFIQNLELEAMKTWCSTMTF